MPSEAEIAENKLDLVNIDQNDIYSVTELSGNIKQVLSATPQFNDILLKGEISNFVQATSGHIYFSLKDQNCAIACAFFRYLQAAGCSDLGDGIQAVAMGTVVVYEPKSQYQLNIKKIIPIGDGISSLKLKRLRDKLEGEGLFSQDRKKPIPILPKKIGIITSKGSAAIKDILTVVNARCPNIGLVMAYVILQGNGAPGNIILALNSLSKFKDIDAIILARGGGPSEDFMAFNDEELVRAIASGTKPIIAGVGHERDVCLTDLAADFRASTPSTAARAAIPDILEMGKNILSLKASVERSYKSYLLAIDVKEKEAQSRREELQKLRNGLSSLSTILGRSYDAYLLGLKIRENEVEIGKKNKEMEAQAKREELQKLRNGLSSLSMNLDRSYDAYLLGLKIRENEVEIVKKDEEIKKAGGESDLLKYKTAIVALIAFLVLIILIFLLRG
jgi:exodeoxyribonuclease VII large subunit